MSTMTTDPRSFLAGNPNRPARRGTRGLASDVSPDALALKCWLDHQARRYRDLLRNIQAAGSIRQRSA